MAVNKQAINQAAVNTGSQFIQFGEAAFSAQSTIAATLTYVFMSSAVLPSVGTLEGYAWQTHSGSYNAKGYAYVTGTAWAQKWETSDFDADATMTGQVFYGGESALMTGSASVSPEITYKWRTSSSQPASASVTAVQTLYGHMVTDAQASSIFYPEGMLKLNGESTYTHDASAKPTILGTAEFADIYIRYEPDGWFAQGTSAVGYDEINYKWFRAATLAADASVTSDYFTGHRPTTNSVSTAAFANTADKTSVASGSMTASGDISSHYPRVRHNTSAPVMDGACVADGTAFVDRFGGYPVTSATGGMLAGAIQQHSASSPVISWASVFADPFQWTWHYSGMDNFAIASFDAIATSFLDADAITFVRSAEVKDFTRSPDTKDFIRVPT